jgi:DNA-binding transcriptional MerR regulator
MTKEDYAMKKGFYRVSELAAEVGVHPDTIKKLEKQGIIVAQRDRNNYRRFHEGEREKVLAYLGLRDHAGRRNREAF